LVVAGYSPRAISKHLARAFDKTALPALSFILILLHICVILDLARALLEGLVALRY